MQSSLTEAADSLHPTMPHFRENSSSPESFSPGEHSSVTHPSSLNENASVPHQSNPLTSAACSSISATSSTSFSTASTEMFCHLTVTVQVTNPTNKKWLESPVVLEIDAARKESPPFTKQMAVIASSPTSRTLRWAGRWRVIEVSMSGDRCIPVELKVYPVLNPSKPLITTSVSISAEFSVHPTHHVASFGCGTLLAVLRIEQGIPASLLPPPKRAAVSYSSPARRSPTTKRVTSKLLDAVFSTLRRSGSK